jgi:hypothetical protein
MRSAAGEADEMHGGRFSLGRIVLLFLAAGGAAESCTRSPEKSRYGARETIRNRHLPAAERKNCATSITIYPAPLELEQQTDNCGVVSRRTFQFGTNYQFEK